MIFKGMSAIKEALEKEKFNTNDYDSDLLNLVNKIKSNKDDYWDYVSKEELEFYLKTTENIQQPESKTFDVYRDNMTTERALKLLYDYYDLIETSNSDFYKDRTDNQMSIGDLETMREKCKSASDPALRELAAACDFIANTEGGKIFNAIKGNNQYVSKDDIKEYNGRTQSNKSSSFEVFIANMEKEDKRRALELLHNKLLSEGAEGIAMEELKKMRDKYRDQDDPTLRELAAACDEIINSDRNKLANPDFLNTSELNDYLFSY